MYSARKERSRSPRSRVKRSRSRDRDAKREAPRSRRAEDRSGRDRNDRPKSDSARRKSRSRSPRKVTVNLQVRKHEAVPEKKIFESIALWHKASESSRPLFKRAEFKKKAKEDDREASKRSSRDEESRDLRSKLRKRKSKSRSPDEDDLRKIRKLITSKGDDHETGGAGKLLTERFRDPKADTNIEQKITERLGSYYKKLEATSRNESEHHELAKPRTAASSVHSRLGYAPGEAASAHSLRGGRFASRGQRNFYVEMSVVERERNYRSASDEKNVVRLFDPTAIPKGRSYYTHDDRDVGRRDFRGGGRRRGGNMGRNSFSSNRQPSGADGLWTHDMFEADEDGPNDKEQGSQANNKANVDNEAEQPTITDDAEK